MKDLENVVIGAITLQMPKNEKGEIIDKCLHSDLINAVNEAFALCERCGHIWQPHEGYTFGVFLIAKTLDMEQTGFFSREDPQSLKWMQELFMPKEGYVWFVESTESQKWITVYENCSDEHCLTSNPNEARCFKTQMQATTYIVNNKLGNRFIATEHEFVSSDG